MLIKSFILHKGTEFTEAEIIVKDAVIKEINFNTFKNIYPEENNSKLCEISEIKKVHNPERIQNGCKYYIQHSIDGEVMNLYLDINILQFLRLRSQVFIKQIINSKEFKVSVIGGIVVGVVVAIILSFIGKK